MMFVNKKLFDQKQIAKFLNKVLKGNVFKFAYVHIEVSFITSFMKWRYYILCKKYQIVMHLIKWRFIIKKIAEQQPKEQKSY